MLNFADDHPKRQKQNLAVIDSAFRAGYHIVVERYVSNDVGTKQLPRSSDTHSGPKLSRRHGRYDRPSARARRDEACPFRAGEFSQRARSAQGMPFARGDDELLSEKRFQRKCGDVLTIRPCADREVERSIPD